MVALSNLVLALAVVAITYFLLTFFSSSPKSPPSGQRSKDREDEKEKKKENEKVEKKEDEKVKKKVADDNQEIKQEKRKVVSEEKKGLPKKQERDSEEDDGPIPSPEEFEVLNKDLEKKIEEERAQRRLQKGKGRDLNEFQSEENEEEEKEEEEKEEEEEEEEEDELAGIDFAQYDEPSPDFQLVKNNTRCPFAKNSQVMNGEKWDFNLTLEQNVINCIPLLELFNKRVARGEDLDAFLIEIEEERFGDSLESLSKTVKKTLTVLSDNDPSGENAMKEDLRSNFWNYHFGTEYQAYFISVLAPCYPKTHSRHAYGSKHTFILLQPEISFHNKAIKLDYDPKSVRHLVRKRFMDVGQPYDHRDAKEYTMCNWVVRPMEVHLPPIRWWETPIENWD